MDVELKLEEIELIISLLDYEMERVKQETYRDDEVYGNHLDMGFLKERLKLLRKEEIK